MTTRDRAQFGVSSAIAVRWGVAGAVFAAEILWLTSVYTAPDASAASGWRSLLAVFNDGYHYTAAILLSAAIILAVSANLSSILGVLSNQIGYAWLPWLTLHGLALLAFAFLTSLKFGITSTASDLSLDWLALWIATGLSTLVFWLFVLAPPSSWLKVLRQQWVRLALAVAAGTAVWLGGLLAQNLWRPLAEGTLRLSGLLLSVVYPGVSYDPTVGRLGTSSFTVEIFPVCSGYEGISLAIVFVAAYLWLFRRDLNFPRAFLLFPIGILSVWLANVLRVTALVVVGTSISPQVAARGFHSQAGWIGFTLVTLGLIAISHHWLSRPRAEPHALPSPAIRPEIPLLAPLLTLMATSVVAAAMSAGFDAFYPLGVVTTGAILWQYRTAYRPLFGAWSWMPVAIGILVFAIWAVLVPSGDGSGQELANQLADLPAWLAAVWIGFRVIGSTVTVPMAEELAFRGYLIRKLVAQDFEKVRPGKFTWLSFLVSSLLFGLLHQNLLAGALAGAAFAVALYRRGLVGDAIIAHVTSNALIAFSVIVVGRWGFWS